MEHALAKIILISQTIELLANEYKLNIDEARDSLYSSRIIDLINDDETGLYGESALFILSLYENDLKKNSF